MTCRVMCCEHTATWIRFVRHPAGLIQIAMCDDHVNGIITDLIWVDDIDDIEIYANTQGGHP